MRFQNGAGDGALWLEDNEEILRYVMERYDIDGKQIVSAQAMAGGSGPDVETYEQYSVRTEDGEAYLLFVHGDQIVPNRVYPQGMFRVTGVNWFSAAYGAYFGTYRSVDYPEFWIRLDADGTYSFSEAFYSSYYGHGAYTLTGDTLSVMSSSGGISRFRVGDGTLTFLEGLSENFMYVHLPDGAVFRMTEGGTSTPWEWTSAVTAEQIDAAVRTSGWTERFESALSRRQIEDLAARLNEVRPEEVYPGRGFPDTQWITLVSGTEIYRLSWAGGTVVLSFDDATAARWPIPEWNPNPCWEIHNAALYAFLAGLVTESE